MAAKIESKEFIKNIVAETKDLPKMDLKEILDFIYFIKAKSITDPSQAYFWTKMWQKMEAEAEEDKKHGRIIGSGKVNDLLKKLKDAG